MSDKTREQGSLEDFEKSLVGMSRKHLETRAIVDWYLMWALERAGIEFDDPHSLEAAIVQLRDDRDQAQSDAEDGSPCLKVTILMHDQLVLL